MDKPEWYYIIRNEKMKARIALLTGDPEGAVESVRQMMDRNKTGTSHRCQVCSHDLGRVAHSTMCSIKLAYQELFDVSEVNFLPKEERTVQTKVEPAVSAQKIRPRAPVSAHGPASDHMPSRLPFK